MDLFDQLWELDKEKSFAELIITPVRRGEKLVLVFSEEVKIRPYPNPFGYGGLWGYGGVDTEAEVEKLIKDFKRYNGRWVEMGLKVEIVRKPETTEPEYWNEVRRHDIEKNPEYADKSALAQMRLI